MSTKSKFYYFLSLALFAPLMLCFIEYNSNKHYIKETKELLAEEFDEVEVKKLKTKTIDHGSKALEFKVKNNYFDILPSSIEKIKTDKPYFLTKKKGSYELIFKTYDNKEIKINFIDIEPSVIKTMIWGSLIVFSFFGCFAAYNFIGLKKEK